MKRMKKESNTRDSSALAVGIDIGTTTISATVIDLTRKEQIEVLCEPHNSYVKNSVFFEQSVSVILEQAEDLISRIYKSYHNIVSIGLTGQMHGIVYLNGEGEGISPLMNWQDKRADALLEDGMSACERIEKLTGEKIAAGYGLATHYYNLINGLVPRNAVGFCSIMDCFAMRLCDLKKPLTHASVAASFGMFDLKKSSFMLDSLSEIGIEATFLPEVTAENKMVGKWKGIPVSVAIGDNQASFLGSVKNNRESVLVNMGTGSQISAVGEHGEYGDGIECRPLINGKTLICGSALCGGSAYALIESFFRSYVSSAGMGDASQYSIMNALAAEAYEKGEHPLMVKTLFCGTRTDPRRRGFVENIDLNHFTPSALILGVLHGMCDELYGLYQAWHVEKTNIVASGGAIRKNQTLTHIMEDKFGMPVSVSTVKEEAATGAALFSAHAAGIITYKDGFSDYLQYI